MILQSLIFYIITTQWSHDCQYYHYVLYAYIPQTSKYNSSTYTCMYKHTDHKFSEHSVEFLLILRHGCVHLDLLNRHRAVLNPVGDLRGRAAPETPAETLLAGHLHPVKQSISKNKGNINYNVSSQHDLSQCVWYVQITKCNTCETTETESTSRST